VEEPFEGREGLDWCRELLGGYDLSKLSRLTVRDGSKRKTLACVWGTCYYPTKTLPSYRITCSLKPPFPAAVHTRKSPLYAHEDGTYPPVPDGLVKGQEFVATGPKPGRVRRWFRLYGKTRLDTLDEAIVWIVAHESYHFLRRTRQIPGRNAEIDADRFSDEALEHFREGWAYRFRALQEHRTGKAKNAASRKRAGRDHIILGVPHAGREGGA
jgi:hypothetical protein